MKKLIAATKHRPSNNSQNPMTPNETSDLFQIKPARGVGTLGRAFTRFQSPSKVEKGTVGSVYSHWNTKIGNPVTTQKPTPKELDKYLNSSFGVTISKFATHVIKAHNQTQSEQLSNTTLDDHEFDTDFIRQQLLSFADTEVQGLRPGYKEDCCKALTDFLEYCCGIRQCDQQEGQETTKVKFETIWATFLSTKTTLGLKVALDDQPQEAQEYKQVVIDKLGGAESIESDDQDATRGILPVAIKPKNLAPYHPFTAEDIDPYTLIATTSARADIAHTGIEYLTAAFADYCIETGKIYDGKIPVKDINTYLNGFVEANQAQLKDCAQDAQQLLKNVIFTAIAMVQNETHVAPTHLTKDQLLAGAGYVQTSVNKALFKAVAPKDYTQENIEALRTNAALVEPDAIQALIASRSTAIHGVRPDVLGAFFETIFAKIAESTGKDPETIPFTFKRFKTAVKEVIKENPKLAQFRHNANRAVYAFKGTDKVSSNATFVATDIRAGVTKMHAYNNQRLVSDVVDQYLETTRAVTPETYTSIKATHTTSTPIYQWANQFARAYLQKGLTYDDTWQKATEFVNRLGLVEHQETAQELMQYVIQAARAIAKTPWITEEDILLAAQKIETARANLHRPVATSASETILNPRLKLQVQQLASLEKKGELGSAIYQYDDSDGQFSTMDTGTFGFGKSANPNQLDPTHPLVAVVEKLIEAKWETLQKLTLEEDSDEANAQTMNDRHREIAEVVRDLYGATLDLKKQHALIAAAQCAIYSGDGYDNPLVDIHNGGNGEQLIWGNVAAVLSTAEKHSGKSIKQISFTKKRLQTEKATLRLPKQFKKPQSNTSLLGNVELYKLKEKREKEGVCPNLAIFKGVVKPIYEHFRTLRNEIGNKKQSEITDQDIFELLATTDAFFKALRFWHPTTATFQDNQLAADLHITDLLTSHESITYTLTNAPQKNQFFHSGQDWGACPSIKATAKINSHRKTRDSFELGMMLTVWGDILWLAQALKLDAATLYDSTGKVSAHTDTSLSMAEVWGSLRDYLLDHSVLAGNKVKWDVLWYFMKELGLILPKKHPKSGPLIGKLTYYTMDGNSNNKVKEVTEDIPITDLHTFQPDFSKLTPSDRKIIWKQLAT